MEILNSELAIAIVPFAAFIAWGIIMGLVNLAISIINEISGNIN